MHALIIIYLKETFLIVDFHCCGNRDQNIYKCNVFDAFCKYHIHYHQTIVIIQLKEFEIR